MEPDARGLAVGALQQERQAERVPAQIAHVGGAEREVLAVAPLGDAERAEPAPRAARGR